MTDFTLHQMKVLRTVAQTGSFTRAAEVLYVGQPAVSQHVAAMERMLGVTLVYRAGRGVRLTDAGRLVVEYSERIARLIEQLEAGIDGLRGLTTGRLVVGAGQTPGDYILPRVLGLFRQQHPGVSVELEIAGTAKVVEWLLRHIYDLGFIGDRIDHPDLELEPFVADEVVLFTAADHPLAGTLSVPLADVMTAGLIVREPGSATRATGERALRAAGMEPRIAMELGSNEAVKQAAMARLGVGMLSAFAVALEVEAGRLVCIDATGFECRRLLYIARHRAAPLTHAQEAFVALARQMWMQG